MRKVSVAKLIESAIFNDAEAWGVSTWEMFERKFDDLFEGNPEFVESCSKGILDPILYMTDCNTVFNGHHRVLIAWLLNVEFIGFTEDWTEDLGESGPELF
jgi:hypothetical protein